MSEICLSSLPPASTTVKSVISGCSFTSAFIVVRPVTRHGLSRAALEKHRCHFLPGFAYFDVSTIEGSIICSHGLDASPCGVAVRWAIWRSKSAWLKNFVWPVPAAAELAAPLGAVPVGLVEGHAAAPRGLAARTGASAPPRPGLGGTTSPHTLATPPP